MLLSEQGKQDTRLRRHRIVPFRRETEISSRDDRIDLILAPRLSEERSMPAPSSAWLSPPGLDTSGAACYPNSTTRDQQLFPWRFDDHGSTQGNLPDAARLSAGRGCRGSGHDRLVCRA